MRENAIGSNTAALLTEATRLSARLQAAGDNLLADLALTAARWQVLTAVALSAGPEPVARLARTMGASRQNVQRLVNELVTDRLVRLEENPHHKRARLVVLTPRGRKALQEAERRQIPWANVLATGLTLDQVNVALRVLRTLRTRLETSPE